MKPAGHQQRTVAGHAGLDSARTGPHTIHFKFSYKLAGQLHAVVVSDSDLPGRHWAPDKTSRLQGLYLSKALPRLPRKSKGFMGVLDLVIRPSELVALLRLKRKVSEWKKRSAAQ